MPVLGALIAVQTILPMTFAQARLASFAPVYPACGTADLSAIAHRLHMLTQNARSV